MQTRISLLGSLVLIFCGAAGVVKAAVPAQIQSPQPRSILHAQAGGAVQGGVAGHATSLLDIRTTVASGGHLERIVIDVGDQDAKKLTGKVGYYTVQMNATRQVVVSFQQNILSHITDQDLLARMKKSSFVEHAQLSVEPMSQTTELILQLKKSAALHTYSVSGGKATARVVLDFSEDKAQTK